MDTAIPYDVHIMKPVDGLMSHIVQLHAHQAKGYPSKHTPCKISVCTVDIRSGSTVQMFPQVNGTGHHTH